MLKAWSSLRLHVQLALASSILLAITISIGTWFNIQSQQQKLIENTRREAVSLANNLAISGGYFIITDKLDELETLLIQSTSFPNITMTRVISADGQTLSHVKKNTSGEIIVVFDMQTIQTPETESNDAISSIDWPTKTLTIWRPIRTSSLLGWIKMEASLDSVASLQQQTINDNILGAFAAITIDVLALLAILYVPARGFRKVVDFASSMTDNAGARIDSPGGSYEIDKLIKALNSSSSKLARQRDTLRLQSENLKKLNDTLEQHVKERTEALEKSNERLRLFNNAVEQNPIITIITDINGIIEYVNPAFTTTTGYTSAEAIGRTPAILKSGKMPDAFYQDLWHTILSGKAWSGLIRNKKSNGELYWDQTQISSIKNAQGEITHFLAIQNDVTDNRQIEEQLRRSQKMDALGKLTGGVAHDYNNLLAIITGYAEQLSSRLEQNSKLAKYAHEIKRAADRGADLTRKLLTFSKQKAASTTIVDINTLLQSQRLMLEKTLTARIKLVFDLADDLWSVKLDSGDLEDVIINMSINAMHAMKSSGQLSIQTRNVHLEAQDAQSVQLAAGDYVFLSLTDTGCGMDEATREKIFDPFYSTKDEFGTGLGLSQVYGFMERCGGAIKVHSEPGHGCCFTLYFPRSQQPLTLEQNDTEVDTTSQGSECLLVVDDEPAMLELAHDILSSQGYRVLSASDGEQALAILEQETVDLVITDVIMPNMDGYQLAARIQQLYPHIKLQIISGFSDDRHSNMTDETLHKNMLSKPCSSAALLARVRQLLDEKD